MNEEGQIRIHSDHKHDYSRWMFCRRNSWLAWVQCLLRLLLPSLLYAQTPTREQLTGTWIGVHTEWDVDFFCPLPIYLRLDADSTYHLGMVDGSAGEIRSTWAVRGDSVRLDTIRYAPRLVQVQNDLLRIGTGEPMVFRRFKTIPIDSVRTFRQLNGRVWASDSSRISLFTDGRVSIENALTKQRTTHFWRLAKFDTSVFLIVWGSGHNRDSGYKLIWQVSTASANQLQFIGGNGLAMTTQTLRLIRTLTSNDSCQSSGFQTCSNCFQKHWNVTSIYQADKRYELKQVVEKHYQPVQQAGQSGLLTVQFVVNCAGQLGPMDVKGFGDDYCPKVFANQLVDQFQKICRDHVAKPDFLRPRNELTASLYDIVVTLTFRLKNGQLIDILP